MTFEFVALLLHLTSRKNSLFIIMVR